ncbi:MAG: FISUMP domain-containing protein [Candidatus Electryoneaceae bacterium]|nr:FISUMP domain-containing protein [Candidatus Electryoneaceae bacterium]
MKTLKLFFLATIILASYTLTAQVAITTDGTDPDGSAMLDVKSTEKGVLIPRMTQTEIEAILNPANGLTVFCTTDDTFYAFILAANVWKEIQFGTGTITLPFVCGNSFTDDRDSKSYTTVEIGTQCWMAENLNVGIKIAGSGNQIDNSTLEKYCYGDSDANCNTYGGLYQWNEMMQYSTIEGVQGVCPTGWHLPTDAELTTLTDYVSSQSGYQCNSNSTFIAKALAATTIWNTSGIICAVGNNLSANNTTGFKALPGGYRDYAGSFGGIDGGGYWWSSTETSSNDAWVRHLGYNSGDVDADNDSKQTGFSVRCLRD